MVRQLPEATWSQSTGGLITRWRQRARPRAALNTGPRGSGTTGPPTLGPWPCRRRPGLRGTVTQGRSITTTLLADTTTLLADTTTLVPHQAGQQSRRSSPGRSGRTGRTGEIGARRRRCILIIRRRRYRESISRTPIRLGPCGSLALRVGQAARVRGDRLRRRRVVPAAQGGIAR